jgi:choline dehydrogenase-like flavoprotein
MKFTQYRQLSVDDSWDAIVIGSRIGGLTTAALLSSYAGKKVLVLERHSTNKELLALLAAQWGNYGLPPGKASFGMHAIVANHYFEGGNYPVGGRAGLPRQSLR